MRFLAGAAALLLSSAPVACGSSAARVSAPSAPAPSPPASTAAAPPEGRLRIYDPKPDTHVEDASLDPGTVVVEVRDADDQPLAGARVFLAEIAKDPMPDVNGVTDTHGLASLSAPGWGGRQARVVATRGISCFLGSSFPVPARGGVRAVVHSYEVTDDLAKALVVFEAFVYVEATGSDLTVSEGLVAYNLGKIAWFTRTPLDLPADATGFDSAVFTDTSFEAREENGHALITGTLPPGKHELEMRWHVPRHAGGSTLDVPLPPHVAIAHVEVPAGKTTTLRVADFPDATPQTSAKGESILITERKVSPKEPPLRSIAVTVQDVGMAKR